LHLLRSRLFCVQQRQQQLRALRRWDLCDLFRQQRVLAMRRG
jgi:hypothetical protein